MMIGAHLTQPSADRSNGTSLIGTATTTDQQPTFGRL
jgi:hypothetical protein